MRKKTLKILFTLVVIFGVAIGFLIPWDMEDFERAKNPIQGGVYDIAKRMGQLGAQNDYAKYLFLAHLDDASVQLMRIEKDIPEHSHSDENHFIYIFRGKATVTMNGNPIDAHQGQMIIVPDGMKHSIDISDDTPVEVIVFSSPPAMEENMKLTS